MTGQVLVVVYVAIVLVIGLAGRRRQTTEEYVVGGRMVKAFGLTAAIFATLITESLFFFAVAITSRFGPLGGLSGVLGPAAGLMLLAALAPRIHAMGRTRRFVSVTEYCTENWGPLAGKFGRWTMLLLLQWIIILQINLNSRLMSALLGWSPEMSTWLVVGIVGTYLVLGGYFAVIRTDLFQSMVLALMVITPLFIRPVPDAGKILDERSLSSDVAFIFIMSLAMTIVRPELWQRIFSAASGSVARRSIGYATILYVGFGIVLLYYAFALVQANPQLSSMEAFSEGYRYILPPPLAALLPVILMAAMMSSLDSAVFMLSVDLASRTSQNRQLWTRGLILATLVAGGLVSLYVYDALGFAYRLDGFVALLATPLVASLLIDVTRRELAGSLASGGVAYLLLIASGRLTEHPAEAVLGSLVTGLTLGLLVAGRHVWRRGGGRGRASRDHHRAGL